MHRKHVLKASALIFLTFFSINACACSCFVYSGPRSDLLRAQAMNSAEIFLLQATAVRVVERVDPSLWFNGPEQHANFKIRAALKTRPNSSFVKGMDLNSVYAVSGADCGRRVEVEQKELKFWLEPGHLSFSACDLVKGYKKGDREIISRMLQAKASQASPANWAEIKGGELPKSAVELATLASSTKGVEVLLWGEQLRETAQIYATQSCPQHLQIDGPEVTGRWRLSLRESGSAKLINTVYIEGPDGESELPLPDFSKQANWHEPDSSDRNDGAFVSTRIGHEIRFKQVRGCRIQSASVMLSKGILTPRLMRIIGSVDNPYTFFESYWYEGSVDGMERGELPKNDDYADIDCAARDRYQMSCLRNFWNTIIVGKPVLNSAP